MLTLPILISVNLFLFILVRILWWSTADRSRQDAHANSPRSMLKGIVATTKNMRERFDEVEGSRRIKLLPGEQDQEGGERVRESDEEGRDMRVARVLATCDWFLVRALVSLVTILILGKLLSRF